jgi:uncharacterized protein (DUF952 family)
LEYDLLFTFIEPDDWKSNTESGYFSPEYLTEKGFVECFEGKFAEQIANQVHSDSNQLLLLVIDPLRIHEPIKKEVSGELEYYRIQGKFSIDAIIDRIKLKKSKDGQFNVRIKHFD